MNTTAITALATLLTNIPSKYDTGFNMSGYLSTCQEYTHVGHQCGSTACIAGWAAQYIEPDGSVRMKSRRWDEIEHLADRFGDDDPQCLGSYGLAAAKTLGITYEQALILFEPMNHGLDERDWETVTPRQAAKVLRHLAKTGNVEWEVAFR